MVYDLTDTTLLVMFRKIHEFGVPDMCPICHNGIEPVMIIGYEGPDAFHIQVVYRCPRTSCQELFIVTYKTDETFDRKKTYRPVKAVPTTIAKRSFSALLNELSPTFTLIYNQALEAEVLKLEQVCGVGYRKALEFLVKDYVIKHLHVSGVEKTYLMKVITDHIKAPRVQEMAKRAVWLGNDEAHYERLWTEYDIKELKTLIDLTVHYMEMELTGDKFMKEMPEGRK